MKQPEGGMPRDIAAGIAGLGKQFTPQVISATIALYAGVPRSYEAGAIEVISDIAYGGDERQRLDIHVPRSGRQAGGADVLMFVHGGGFVRGNREGRRNIPDFFAANGCVGVNVTYRLAPQHRWPAGGLDMGAAVAWVHANIARYGGDPDRIYFMGESAGAFHIATCIFRPELLPADTPRVAGAILVSGAFLVNSTDPREGEADYFGEDRSRWAEIAFPGNITHTDIPVLFTMAEFDPPHIDQGGIQMIHELVMHHGVMPRMRQLIGHNHLSGGLSIGTSDATLSGEILDFMAACNRRRAARA